jgi:hypothetical protein
MVTLILTAAVLLSALLSVAKTTEMQLNNKVTKETFDRQSGNINNNSKLLPEAVYVRSGRCR